MIRFILGVASISCYLLAGMEIAHLYSTHPPEGSWGFVVVYCVAGAIAEVIRDHHR